MVIIYINGEGLSRSNFGRWEKVCQGLILGGGGGIGGGFGIELGVLRIALVLISSPSYKQYQNLSSFLST